MAIFKRRPEEDINAVPAQEDATTGLQDAQAAVPPMGGTGMPARGGGVPGVQRTPPDMTQLLGVPTAQRRIGTKEVQEATDTLRKYKSGKANLEQRLIEDEQWYKIRHWEVMRSKLSEDERTRFQAPPSSGWLFNCIANKHADAMDNYPEPNVLPREKSDSDEAKKLSSVLPVVLERNGFEQAYSDNWWKKLKHGTGVYGVFWDTHLENGLGDISIIPIDLLRIFWEPGITDIQKSRNLFIVDIRDNDLLEQEYPQLEGKLGGCALDVAQYVYDDDVDNSDKSVVVDWYYKVRAANGRTLVHYAKFVGNELLYASENDEQYTERGYYDHGKYPVVFDCMFPEEGTPVGFGYVSVLKDPQLYIDRLSGAVMEASVEATKPRFWVSRTSSVNKKQFLDWNEPLVDVEGGIDDTRIKQIQVTGIDAYTLNALQMKIDEMKETASNRDFSSGGTTSGVTAASAIAALQEAGNKVSRDMIGGSYRAYTELDYLCIELMRQFYDEAREFRITGPNGDMSFESYDNSGLKEQQLPPAYPGQEQQPDYVPAVRVPVFDITIKAQKKNPFSKASQNELAKELYSAGFFDPSRAQEAMGALELMEFEGKDKVEEDVRSGATLLQVVQQQGQQMQKMAAIIQGITGQDLGVDMQQGAQQAGSPAGKNTGNAAPKSTGTGSVNAGAAAAQVPRNGYAEALAARSVPNMNAQTGGVQK